MPTLGDSALMLRPGENLRPRRHSASAVFHVLEGLGAAVIDGNELRFAPADTKAWPTHADVTLAKASNRQPAFVFMVDDTPMQRKLGCYEQFQSTPDADPGTS